MSAPRSWIGGSTILRRWCSGGGPPPTLLYRCSDRLGGAGAGKDGLLLSLPLLPLRNDSLLRAAADDDGLGKSLLLLSLSLLSSRIGTGGPPSELW